MSATRSAAVKNHLGQLIKYRSNVEKFPIIVSQDGDNDDVTSTINEFVNETNRVYFIHVCFYPWFPLVYYQCFSTKKERVLILQCVK